MELNKRATRLAIATSLPIVLLALLISLGATFANDPTGKMEAYKLGVRLYLVFGYPLTAIIKIFAGAGGLNNGWWALPLLTVLFIFQWIIWAQLIVLIGKLVCVSARGLFPIEMSQHVWPDRIVKADGRRFRIKTSIRLNQSLSKPGGVLR